MPKRIGEILVEQNLISVDQIEKALALQATEDPPRRLGEILIEMGLGKNDFLKALSIQVGFPFLTSDQFPKDATLDHPIAFEFLRDHAIFPIRLTEDRLTVVVADPFDYVGLNHLKTAMDRSLEIYLGYKEDILESLEAFYGSRGAVMKRILDVVDEEEDADEPEIPETGEVSQLKDLAQDHGIIRLVNVLIENAVQDRCSDIHVEPFENELRVRYRVDGILHEAESFPRRMQPAISSRLKLMAQMNIAERRLPQDGRIKGVFAGREIDIRVSTLPTVHGESIVMRLLDKESAFFSLEELGFSSDLLPQYEELIHLPFGMFLLTGPTGSGKTTTLYASLDKLNSPEKKIITVEEPVEYQIRGVNQIQVRPRIGLTFANGLRSIVRQDPDIIMVGEIRDLETAGIAIHSALTGHFLFSTLHTNDAPGAITRLMDMGVENFLVSSTLVGVMAQRLIRRICPDCREPYKPGPDVLRVLGGDVDEIYRGRGCEACKGTGYRGRVGIYELLPIDDDMRVLIMENATAGRMKEAAIGKGMRTLRMDGLKKVREGVTTVDEVLRVT